MLFLKPINPKTVAVSGAATNFPPMKQAGMFTMQSTVPLFFLITPAGTPATADGAACHYLSGAGSYDLLANPGDTVSVIAASTAGVAYITEWA